MDNRYELGNFVTPTTEQRLELDLQKPSLTIEGGDSRYAFYLGRASNNQTVVIALHERMTNKLRIYRYIDTTEGSTLDTEENRNEQLLSVIRKPNRVSLKGIEPTLRKYIPGVTRESIRERVPRIYTPLTDYAENGLGPHEKKGPV